MNKIILNQKTSCQGFTLIELLLYVAIVGSLLIAVSLFMALCLDARVKNQTISEVDQQGNLVMEQITQTIRNASGITSPAAGSSASSLTVTVPTPSFSPTVFSLASGVLQIKEGTGATVSLTNSKVQVTGLTFTNLSASGTNGIVRVSFTLSRVNPNNRNEYDYQKTFITSASLRQ